MKKILVIQTAFAGDLILTLPLVEAAHAMLAPCSIDLLCIPGTADLLRSHPDVEGILPYDKRGDPAGILLLIRWRSKLRTAGYDIVLSPHRSFRSALLALFTRAPRRISFDTSAGGGRFWTDRVPYCSGLHEVDRVCSLLRPLVDDPPPGLQPRLYPGAAEEERVDAFLRREGIDHPIVCVAPGSVWATKRWLPEGYASFIRAIAGEGFGVVLVGGASDRDLCAGIREAAAVEICRSAAGELSLLETAALIRRARLLVGNDSAPVHMASAVGTPVVDIYGATSPAFGFTPRGVPHRIVRYAGLPCHPCAIHGGERCPDSRYDFACMKRIAWEEVRDAARELLA